MIEAKFFTKWDDVGEDRQDVVLCLHLTMDTRPQANDLVNIQRLARTAYKMLPETSSNPEDAWFDGLEVLTNDLNEDGLQAKISIDDLPMVIRQKFEQSLQKDLWKTLHVTFRRVLTIELARV